MSKLGTIVRRFLAGQGYLLTRVEPEIPPTVASCLRAYAKRINSPLGVVCLDNEVRIQSEILEVFPAERVTFVFHDVHSVERGPAPGPAPPPAPSGRFVAVIDLDGHPLDGLASKFPWLKQAEAVLLRARLGSFWAGEMDLCRLIPRIEKWGFHLADVLSSFPVSPLQSPSGSVVLVCEGGPAASPLKRPRRYRVLEACTYLSRPIVGRNDFQLLAGRGAFGFAAGVCNPGALIEDGQKFLLAKGERTPWALQKTDESQFFASAQPMLLRLDSQNRIAGAGPLAVEGAPDSSRAEDFRLFRFRGQAFSNHSVISTPRGRPTGRRRLRLELMRTSVVISALDIPGRRLAWRGYPIIDRPPARTEKNWVFFTDGGRLFLLYSFAPYLLLSAQNWPGLDFKTVVETRLDLPFDGDGLSWRNSINPVDYDDGHWLHIVHQVHPGKQYSFRAVLISKRTLRPVRITARPLARGWHSVSASILYLCSAIAGKEDVLLFAGLDDAATAVAAIPRARLDAEWAAISPEEPGRNSGINGVSGATPMAAAAGQNLASAATGASRP